MDKDLERRQVLIGLAAVGGLATLTACGGGSSTPKQGAGSPAPRVTSAKGTGARPLVSLADLSVGQTVSATSPDGPVLITRTGQRSAVAFSAICTHQGCTVGPGSGGVMQCPCHGSQYNARTGAVVRGPAPAPLHPYSVSVRSNEVFPA